MDAVWVQSWRRWGEGTEQSCRCGDTSCDGEVISSRASARAAFFGRSGLRRNIRWDPLDAVYFAGYAIGSSPSLPGSGPTPRGIVG